MKTQPYIDFSRRIHQYARQKGELLRVMFELTYRCNFSCGHCYVPWHYRKKRELTTRQVCLIIDQLSDLGCFYLGFTGGEPFMRRDMLQIAGYARKKGLQVIIYTNGSLINQKISAALAQIGLNKVDITIPAMTKEAFTEITGVAGAQRRVFDAIAFLHKNGVKLGFKTCLLKENASQIKAIRDFSDRFGASHRLDTILSRRLDGDAAPFQYRGTLDSSWKPASIKERLPRRERNLAGRSLFPCGTGESQAAITPQGELKLCLMIDYPKFRILTGGSGMHLARAWERLKGLALTIQPDAQYKCDTCGMRRYCNWCPAKGWLYNHCFTSCDPEIKRWLKFNLSKTVPKVRRR